MKESAVLLIDCPDRKGLVARVSSLLYRQGPTSSTPTSTRTTSWASSSCASSGRSTARGLRSGRQASPAGAKAPPPAVPFDLEAFKAAFAPLAAELGMRWKLTSTAPRPRVALFCSQYLHCMADLLYRWRTGELRVRDSPHRLEPSRGGEAGRLLRHSLRARPGDRGYKRARPRRGSLNCSARHKVELVVLARYMQVLSPAFVARYPAAIINVHHSFLPAFTGARPYHAAHARGVKLIGATSHYVTEVLDDGPIIEQDVARISHRDQVEDLVARGRDLERMVLSRAVRWHLDRRILCYGNKTVVFD